PRGVRASDPLRPGAGRGVRRPQSLGARRRSPERAPLRASPQDVGVIVDPVVSAVLLGFLLGLQHATDPDHLVAVATIVTRERRFVDGALVGVVWGVGHMATLTLAGALIVGFRLTVTREIGGALELLVAAMLILLGSLRLR